jgi:hypothetical protein
LSALKILCNSVLFVLWAASSIVCAAQLTNTGIVSGTVIAPDGNPVSSAVVTLSGIDGPVHTVSSAADGSFLAKELPSGSYTLKATSTGFAPHEESSVIVDVGRTTHLSIQLTVASTQQSVNVSAAPVTFDTSQTSSVVNIDRDRVEELPIPSRNYLSFVLFSPQVAAANPALQQ